MSIVTFVTINATNWSVSIASLNEKVLPLTEKMGKVKSEPVADVKPNVSEEHSSGEEESDE